MDKDVRLLKQRIEVLERENLNLKKSLFELSTRYNARKVQPFELDHLLTQTTLEVEEKDDFPVTENNTIFYQKGELKGHSGAVYDVKFSPCGKWLATAGFDKSIRIWDWTTQKERKVLDGHSLSVSDLSWSYCSSFLVSGAYDQSCRIWSVESGAVLNTVETDGFVLCVQCSPIDSNIFYFGTSRNILGMVDKRKPGICNQWLNDSMVNALSVYNDGTTVMTGDSQGNIKSWDTLTGKLIDSFSNDGNGKPISYISSCSQYDEEARIIAVNSYDNILRIYDRGIIQPFNSHTLIHSIKGYKNKNWPIKSSFFRFKDCASIGRGTSAEEIITKSEIIINEPSNLTRFNLEKTSYGLLATGSADSALYVYTVGLQEGSASLVQKIEAHSDRVYTCNFNPNDLVLASGSADFTVKLWAMNNRKRPIKT